MGTVVAATSPGAGTSKSQPNEAPFAEQRDSPASTAPSAPVRRIGISLGHLPVIELLRIGTGLVWLVNLIFIVDPANNYWGSFSATALSFAPTTVGGPGLAQYVSGHPLFFAWSIALITGYLTFSLIFGITTRLACFVGAFFSAVLLATQFGSTFLFPGGTDVGAHPLYILIYGVLVAGGAGRVFSVDVWVRTTLEARRRAPRPARGPIGHPWTATLPMRTVVTYFVAGTVLSFGIGIGLVATFPVQGAGSSGPSTSGTVTYVNMSINLNATNGWPQYTPANFTVPIGRAVFTITDNDSPMSWAGCPCPVSGTVGGVEWVNGSPMSIVPATNVAHSFNIPLAGVQVMSPGLSVVQFSVDFTRAGPVLWYCIVPCGQGTDPYSTPPMGEAGWMAGTIMVT
jgi:hypothetical protein